MTIKFMCAVFLFIVSSCANAVIVDGKFNAQIFFDESDEGIWSKNLLGSEVTGQFWYDTELAPAPNLELLPAFDYDGFTNTWVNFTYLIDGKTIDISKLVGGYSGIQASEFVILNPENNFFRVDEGIIEGDILGDYTYRGASLWVYESDDMIKDGNLEQNFSWINDGSDANLAELYMSRRSNGQLYESHLSMHVLDFTIATREADVPEPSSLSLIVLGLLALVFRRRAS